MMYVGNQILKSKPILDLPFNYVQESLITFVGKGNIAFLKCCYLSKQELIALINYAIDHV